MTLFECQDVMKHWAGIFNRDIRDGEIEAWHKGLLHDTPETLASAFEKYHRNAEIMRWPTPKNIRELIGPAHCVPLPYCIPTASGSSGNYLRRNGEDDITYMERTCGPDWKEKTESGIRAMRRMGIQYGAGVLLPEAEWHAMGVTLPEDEQPERIIDGHEQGENQGTQDRNQDSQAARAPFNSAKELF